MRGLVKNWFVGSSIICAISLLVLLLVAVLCLDFLYDILLILIGFLVASILFFVFGIITNKKIAKRVVRISNIAESSIPKDVSRRRIYSNSTSRDEIEDLCSNLENIVFEIKASERIRNDYISSMSHELRTPLTAIKGWAETMKTGELIDFSTVRRGLDIITKETSRLSKIVDEILDFSIMSSGRLIYNMELVDILAEIEDTVCIFKERAVSEKKS